MGPLETEKLLYDKYTFNKTKLQATKWENIFSNPTSDRGLKSNIYKEFKNTISKTTNNPFKMWGIELKGEFSKGNINVQKT